MKNDKRIFDYYNRIFEVLDRKTDIYVEQTLQQYSLEAVERFRVLIIDCAELYAEKGQPEKGIELVKQIIKFKYQPEWRGYLYRAYFYKKIGKYQEAIDDLTSVNYTRPKPSTEALIQRGDLYVLTKQFDKAIADYESAKTIDKNIEAKMDEKITAAKQKMLENSLQPR